MLCPRTNPPERKPVPAVIGHASTCASQFQWWLIWFQLGTLLLAGIVQYRNWHGARTAVMGALCVLTAIIMHQADGANLQRQVHPTISARVCVPCQQPRAH